LERALPIGPLRAWRRGLNHQNHRQHDGGGGPEQSVDFHELGFTDSGDDAQEG
jgi:hypothetical protein